MQRKMACLSAIFLVCSSVSSSVFAVADGFFLGLQLGQTNVNNLSMPDPVTQTFVKPSNTGAGFRFDMGYNFSRYAAWEVGLGRYAPAEYKFADRQCQSPAKIGFDITGKAMFPVSVVSVFGRAGIAVLRNGNLSIVTTPDGNYKCKTASSITARPLVAAGVSFDLNQSWVVDLSWSRILKGGNMKNADLKALGISYHFTTKYCGQFIC